MLLDFLHAHWHKLGRVEAENEAALNAHLSLHTKRMKRMTMDGAEIVREMIRFCGALEERLSDARVTDLLTDLLTD